ncbi:MAG: hypothetical protein IH975_12335 [Nitrospinae bacterium]|nr:hypothetical protein [Nitrospinota bacterium]
MSKYHSLSIVAVALLIIFIVQPTGGVEPKGASPNSIDGLVEAALEAHGGKKSLQAVQALKVSGRLKSVLRRDQGTSTIYFQNPDKLYSDITFKGSREVRILNGSKGWINTGGTFESAQPGVMLGMSYSLITYRLPLELATRHGDLVHLGQVEQGGTRFDVLELTYSEAIKVRVFLESESKRIAQVAGYINVGGQTVILSRVLDDYRKVAGLAYPFHQRYYSGRTLIAEKWVEDVEANPSLPEGLFAPE